MLPRLVSWRPVGLGQQEVLGGDGTQEEGEGTRSLLLGSL